MKVDEAPLFIKSIGVLLILTSITTLLWIFITILDSKYVQQHSLNVILSMLLQSIYCFVMISLAYGIMMKNKLCYFTWLIMAIIVVISLFISFTSIFKYIMIAVIVIDIVLLTVHPRIRRYCLNKDPVPSEEMQTDAEQGSS